MNPERRYDIQNSVSDVHFKKFVNNLETTLMNRDKENTANKTDNLPTSAIEFIKRNGYLTISSANTISIGKIIVDYYSIDIISYSISI